jgi:hypothetical protein
MQLNMQKQKKQLKLCKRQPLKLNNSTLLILWIFFIGCSCSEVQVDNISNEQKSDSVFPIDSVLENHSIEVINTSIVNKETLAISRDEIIQKYDSILDKIILEENITDLEVMEVSNYLRKPFIDGAISEELHSNFYQFLIDEAPLFNNTNWNDVEDVFFLNLCKHYYYVEDIDDCISIKEILKPNGLIEDMRLCKCIN